MVTARASRTSSSVRLSRDRRCVFKRSARVRTGSSVCGGFMSFSCRTRGSGAVDGNDVLDDRFARNGEAAPGVLPVDEDLVGARREAELGRGLRSAPRDLLDEM